LNPAGNANSVASMARIVGGCAVPHNPFLPKTVAENPDGIDARCFPRVAAAIEEMSPDLIVAFSPDHLNTVFFDNLPSLLVGIVDEFGGPNDDYPPVAGKTLRSDPELGRHIFLQTLRADFDPARSESLVVDHSLLVPLQIMGLDPVVVPIVMNVLAPPILSATRAHAFGAAVGAAIRSYGPDLRVLVLSDGGVIQEVGGPRIRPGRPDGAPDQAWLSHVVELLGAGEVSRLVEEATPRRIAEVGNAAGELLTAVAMLGALGEVPAAELVEPEPEIGHMFGVWRAKEGG
jgi:aromatic ring-opening dioxygenase catalytic subunit (LigB family)